MGCGFSSKEAQRNKAMKAAFAPEELRILRRKFRRIDRDRSGQISREEFMTIPELRSNRLLDRVISLFDEDRNGEVDFDEFINGVGTFTVKGECEMKLRFLFNVYDINRDGYISRDELYQVLRKVVGTQMNDRQLSDVVEMTILYWDKDMDGKISFKEFCSCVGSAIVDDAKSKLSLFN
ncbi:hypothetical protein ACOME3_005223 [Neoechinorhynchus agilis]